MTELERKQESIWPKKVLRYFWKKYMTEKKYFISLVVRRLVLTFVSLLPSIYFKKIIDAISDFAWWDKSQALAIAITILFTIFRLKLSNILVYRLSDFLTINMSVDIMKKIYLECFSYVHKHSYRFFSNNFTGSLIKKINKFVWAYDNITDTLVFELSPILFNLIFILIILWREDWRISLALFVRFIIYSVVQYFLYKWNYPYEIKANEEDSKISWILSDTITNNFNIKVFGSLKREYSKFQNMIDTWTSTTKKKRYRSMIIWSTTALLMVCIEFLVFYIALNFRSKDLISIWFFVLLQLYLIRLMDQLWMMWSIFRHLYRWFSESAEMLEILETPHEVMDYTDKKIKVSSWKIEFNDVTFAYESESLIFDKLNLKIKPGEKIALVWQSGSWKTSIVKLLFRFFDIQSGSISIDWQDISDFTQDSLRNNISLVPQDPVLFHRSIKENISYWNPNASEEEIIAASKMAKCHDFIINLKNWYDTLVWERWIKLSWWERQRVAIARAILENKRILVLDEATSSLDSESEKLIQDAMDEVLRNKTAIVVAHRLSTIMKMDRIIVMENGKIIESGTHNELLYDNWTYKKLRNIQSGSFIENNLVEKP